MPKITQHKVIDWFDFLDPKTGDFGIEVEAELGAPNTLSQLPSWDIKGDGSLQGYGVEFVCKQPVSRTSVENVMSEVLNVVGAAGSNPLIPSVRAGIHIHINMQNYKVKDVIKMLSVYYSMETALIRSCGPSRSGNLFCLRAQDAPAMFQLLGKGFLNNRQTLSSNQLRYSSINVTPLAKFGTLEFRALATTPGVGKVPFWCDVLLKIREYAVNLNSAFEVAERVSGMGSEYWVKDVLGDEIFNKINYPALAHDVYFDTQNAQHFMYTMGQAGA